MTFFSLTSISKHQFRPRYIQFTTFLHDFSKNILAHTEKWRIFAIAQSCCIAAQYAE